MSNKDPSYVVKMSVGTAAINRGIRGSVYGCPISIAGRAITHEEDFYVSKSYAYISNDAGFFVAELPSLAKLFVDTFDKGEEVEPISFVLNFYCEDNDGEE